MTDDTTRRWGVKLPEGAYLYQFMEKKHIASDASDEEWELFVEEYQGAFADSASRIAMTLWNKFMFEEAAEKENKEFQQEWKAILKEKLE